MKSTDAFLTCVLECGKDDLSLLENVLYAWEDVLEQMDFPDQWKFNDVIRAVIALGIIEIKEWLDSRLQENISYEERNALMKIDPEEDICIYCNYRDSNVYFCNNSDLYHKYCQPALDYFAANTGFKL